MCGIAGLVDPHKLVRDHDKTLDLMSECLADRGPDGRGDFLDADRGVAFAHRRLAIFDTSETGAQPMTSAGGRFTIVFNGAIYNHPELRDQLREHGHTFKGTSDTEVMLAAFEQWGVEASLPLFNGMFAFGLLDRESRQVILARDRLGQKPLCMATANGAVAFSSDLGSIQALPDPFAAACREIDPAALRWYLANGAVPWPMSIFRNVQRLAPGGLVKIDLHNAAITRTTWWSPRIEEQGHPGNDTDGLLHKLDSAVERRLRSDRDVGVFLSGGLDSRLVAALAIRHAPSIKAYTLALPGPFDESAEAACMAKKIGISHQCIDVPEADVLVA
ncbi:MAG: asparagine synthase (glutamine-hydrolyzing), partial [Phycisphaerales bacterium]|nr:asparagine synthase (glutamine-hydrolyzing) [Phycisphaerales bacterium]